MNPADFVGVAYSKMDCYELARVVAQKCFGIQYPEVTQFSPTPELVVEEQLHIHNWVEVPFDNRQAGDIVTMSPSKIKAGHVGILISDSMVLHNDKRFGSAVMQKLADAKRRGYHYIKAYRWVS